MRKVQCMKLGIEAEGLDFQPLPGEWGEKIFQHISKQAWKQWMNQQTMLINEYRLNLMEEQAQKFLRDEMQKFLFGDNTN